MTTTEAVLLTIIIIMIFSWVMTMPDGPLGNTRIWDCVDRQTGNIATVKMDYSHGSQCKCGQCSGATEKKAAAEHFEYFENVQSAADLKNTMGTNCNDAQFSYAIDEFGAPGLEFKDWVTSQAVDDQVIQNHAEFIEDRSKQKGQNILGRTYSPDSHDSYDPIDWQGLRRPQAVKARDRPQVPDVDYDLYSKDPTFTWKSSSR